MSLGPMKLSPEGEHIVRKAMQAMEAGRSVEPILAQAQRELSGASLWSVQESISLTKRVMGIHQQESTKGTR